MKPMNTEIEAKFLHIDVDDMRNKLQSVGARSEEPMRLMRRVVIETAETNKKKGYLRVRDEGSKCTLTYKQFDSLSVDGAKELETVIESFDTVAAIFRQLEPTRYSYQESRRETWKLGDVEVVIDEWPWLEPYIEIEGDSTEALKNVSGKLELDWSDAVFGDVMVAYRAEYPHLSEKDTIGDLDEVRFNAELPDLLRSK